MEFLNKNILVTGASSGIGLSVVKKFAEEGANVVLISRNKSELSKITNTLESNYPNQRFFPIVADLLNENEINDIFKKLNSMGIKTLDSVVNNAGIMIDSMLMQQKTQDIHLMFNTNIISMILICKLSLRLLIKNKGGSIINLSSIVGNNGAKGQSVYSSTKSAVIGFTKSLSKELGRLNINVNSISPGFIQTNMTEKYDDDFRKNTLSNISINRLGSVDDISDSVLFLSSTKARYITGHNLQIDGGMII